MQLSKSEELLMTQIWDLGEAPMKDLIERYEEPRPATTTIATLLKRMHEKGFIDFRTEGRARIYFPLVRKQEYVSGQFKGFVRNFFGNSAPQFASFFTKDADMTKEELETLKKMIDNQIAKK